VTWLTQTQRIQVYPADGRYVSFESAATNLVAIPPVFANNLDTYIYVYDRLAPPPTNPYTLASVDYAGVPLVGWSAQISQEGRHVAFTTYSMQLMGSDSGNWTVGLRDLKQANTRVGIFTVMVLLDRT